MMNVIIGKLLVLTYSEIARLKMKYSDYIVDNAIVKELDDAHVLVEEDRLLK